ncbi:hypothetical protein ES711_07190 [Gelidibacter salicanalis]|uniref:Uncharacterized protein n=1 Tax=Gelidibacter salicanalis TaxID=291193 RepID=A0A5C7AIZ0_9FLAO|nr:hypothetical protein [Gelidibacter salicanalis]TXE08287.1 hypothetical protein ES711_07190 [Gelidibacter salicanalis]
MKKIIYIIIGIVIIAMFVSNTSENEFLNKIDNSKDPLNKHFMLRLFKNAKPILESNEYYFSPVFDMKFTNLGLFSIANIESGWMGTLRIDGKYLGENVNKVSKEKYLLIFGKEFKM